MSPPPPPQKPKGRRTWLIVLASVLTVLLLLAVLLYALYSYVFGKIRRLPVTEPSTTFLTEGNQPNEKESTPSPSKPTESEVIPYSKDFTNVLLIGVDSREAGQLHTNSDTIMLLTLDQKQGQIKLTSFQRDMLVKIPGQEGFNKINSAMFGGPERLLATLNYNFKLDLKNYIVIDLTGAEEVVNLLGGVTIDVPDDPAVLNYLNSVIWDTNKELGGDWAPAVEEGGLQLLNGRQAICYARLRKLDTDFNRIDRQQQLLKELYRKFMDAGSLTKLQVLREGLGLISTNLTETELLGMGTSALPKLSKSLERMTVPGNGYFREATINGVSYIVPSINAEIPEIHQFIYGEVFDNGTPVEEYSKYYKENASVSQSTPTFDWSGFLSNPVEDPHAGAGFQFESSSEQETEAAGETGN